MNRIILFRFMTLLQRVNSLVPKMAARRRTMHVVAVGVEMESVRWYGKAYRVNVFVTLVTDRRQLNCVIQVSLSSSKKD